METNSARLLTSTPAAQTPRWYGPATSPYTPDDTQRLPRLGGINDTVPLTPTVLGVVLQDGSTAKVEARDYCLLQAAGWTARWTQRKVTGNNYYPSINHGDKIRPIARVILDARKGERISYRNGDRNDLTRENLILKAKGQEFGFSKRVCPQAPILSRDERARAAVAVESRVGSASSQDRAAVGAAVVRAALPGLNAYRAAGRAAMGGEA
jgi:hypothetical protein